MNSTPPDLLPSRHTGTPRTVATATLLVVDQVTSTERITELGTEAAFEERGRLLALVDSEVRRQGGAVDFMCGDGAISRFATAGEAYAAATQLHRIVHTVSPVGAVPARLRAAIHVDDVLIDDSGRPFGLGVVIAVRSCAFARPDGIVLSNRAVAGLSPTAQRAIEYVGPVPLKGIPNAVCLWSSPSADRLHRSVASSGPGPSRQRRRFQVPIGR